MIVPSEIDELEAYGVRRIFSPSDGQRLGLDSMINLLIAECDRDLAAEPPPPLEALEAGDQQALARWITCIEADALDPARCRRPPFRCRPASCARCSASPVPADRESRP